ncbi:phosphoglycerate dehydrogenase [Rubrobacter marinus]|uniref:2-oxoglutarate reductase n=1 Tax=Rubrobacter marinus TaxID=2653852 RepID=A0A6G8Q2Y7_9ACTN|nr:phosphoglycerate dehydrogenase [Rubrobacter marinus]
MGAGRHRRQAVRQDALQGARHTDRGRPGRDDRQDLPYRPLRVLRLLRHHRHDRRRRARAGVPRLPRRARARRGCRAAGLLEDRGDRVTKVLITEALAESGVELLRREFEVDVTLGLSPEELLETIGEYDGLIIRSATKVTAEVIERAENLKAIGRAGIGVDNIDIEAATKRGIIVANAPESNTIAAAEQTLGLMLAVARKIPVADASLKGGEWKRSAFKGVEVAEKTLGLIGLGHVGAIVARGALGMGMRVLAYDPYISEDRMRSMNVARAGSVAEVLEGSDFVSLHVPRTPQTMNMIDSGALERMRPSAYLINVARGGIVDETALYNALKEGVIAGAALDVFKEEPTTESPLFGLPNVVVTPHLGASTVEAQDRAGVTAAEQVAIALRGLVPTNALNAPCRPARGRSSWLSSRAVRGPRRRPAPAHRPAGELVEDRLPGRGRELRHPSAGRLGAEGPPREDGARAPELRQHARPREGEGLQDRDLALLGVGGLHEPGDAQAPVGGRGRERRQRDARRATHAAPDRGDPRLHHGHRAREAHALHPQRGPARHDRAHRRRPRGPRDQHRQHGGRARRARLPRRHDDHGRRPRPRRGPAGAPVHPGLQRSPRHHPVAACPKAWTTYWTGTGATARPSNRATRPR